MQHIHACFTAWLMLYSSEFSWSYLRYSFAGFIFSCVNEEIVLIGKAITQGQVKPDVAAMSYIMLHVRKLAVTHYLSKWEMEMLILTDFVIVINNEAVKLENRHVLCSHHPLNTNEISLKREKEVRIAKLLHRHLEFPRLSFLLWPHPPRLLFFMFWLG